MASSNLPIPRGWYSVLDSDELAADEIKRLRYFDRELVVVRDAQGKPRVFDAYCPHLGAHLGVGGQVEGGTVRCPFHGWQFRASDGACVEIPYAKRIPPAAKLTTWTTEEANGLVLVWYDAQGRGPDWKVDSIPELAEEGWLRSARLEWTIHTHVQEIIENVVDVAHLKYVHGAKSVPEYRERGSEPGKLHFSLESPDSEDTDVTAYLWGLGVARLRYEIGIPLFELDTQTPIDADTVEARTRIYLRDLGSTEANESATRAVVDELQRQVDADIRIFEHKRRIETPPLCDGDGPIPAFRRWAGQFY